MIYYIILYYILLYHIIFKVYNIHIEPNDMTFPGCHSKNSINIGFHEPSHLPNVGSLPSAARRKVVHLPCWVSISEFQAARGKLGFGKMEKSWISTVLAEDSFFCGKIFHVCFF